MTSTLIYMGKGEEARRREETLREIARQLGYTTRRGVKNGETVGSLSALLAAIADSEITLTRVETLSK